MTCRPTRPQALAYFLPRCDRVRVMPFLDGVPCSIHALVLPDGTAVFRPVEISILRDETARTFQYGGLSTYWDAPAPDREAMREAARCVGEHLREAYGYRGAFGIDGVLTADGFRPTELNTRASAGFTQVTQLDRKLFALLQDVLVLGEDPGVRVADVEALLPLIDADPGGRPVAFVKDVVVGDVTEALTWDGERFDIAPRGRETDDVLVMADTPSGLFAKVQPCAALEPRRAAGDGQPRAVRPAQAGVRHRPRRPESRARPALRCGRGSRQAPDRRSALRASSTGRPTRS